MAHSSLSRARHVLAWILICFSVIYYKDLSFIWICLVFDTISPTNKLVVVIKFIQRGDQPNCIMPLLAASSFCSLSYISYLPVLKRSKYRLCANKVICLSFQNNDRRSNCVFPLQESFGFSRTNGSSQHSMCGSEGTRPDVGGGGERSADRESDPG